MKRRWLLVFCTLIAFAMSAHGDDKYPSRPVTVIVPQATGGANDAIARVIAQKLSSVMNRPFLVDNRPGAGGNIATAFVAKARPDGYTLLLTANSMLVINPALYRSPGFDPVKDFEPVTLVATAGFVIAANPSFPANSIKELIAAAKASPEPLLYGSAGVGTINHLLGEMFNRAAGIHLAHVPYKAATTAVADLMSGQIPLAVLSVPVSLGMVQAGKMKVLGVANEHRIAALPDAPTIGETLKGFGATPWYGIVAPAGTPKAIVEQLHAAVQQVLDAKDVQEKLIALGCEVRRGNSTQFAALIRDDLPKWARVVAESGASVE